MSWYVEHLHRDGSVLSRVKVAERVPETIASPVSDENEPAIQAVADVNAAPTLASLTFGRALDNDIVLDDPHVAPHHAQLNIDANGMATLVDLGTQNKLVNSRNKRVSEIAVTSDDTIRIGQSLVRVRSIAWALAPERALARYPIWPLGLLGLVLVLCYAAWEIWLGDVNEVSPQYLYRLSGEALAICAWSGMYAIFGRLVSGVDRFFSHLGIAATGYLVGTFILTALETLAFATSWLWPIRITEPVVVIVAACTVRFHLRLADPRHWKTLRVGLVVVAALAIVIPIAQLYISSDRLTNVQTHSAIKHPALRIADPIPVADFVQGTDALKAKVDAVRKKKDGESDGGYSEYDYDAD
jgi:hypothetical protein